MRFVLKLDESVGLKIHNHVHDFFNYCSMCHIIRMTH